MPDDDEACAPGLTMVFSSPDAKWDAWSAPSASGTEVEESEFAVGARKESVDDAEVNVEDAEEEEGNAENGRAVLLDADDSDDAATA
jgi:hypothetical protein